VKIQKYTAPESTEKISFRPSKSVLVKFRAMVEFADAQENPEHVFETLVNAGGEDQDFAKWLRDHPDAGKTKPQPAARTRKPKLARNQVGKAA
jgi:hypothetical protein